MAEESKVAVGSEGVAETQDRGLFDFMGKKEDQKEDHTKHQAEEEVIVAEMEKVHVSEPEPAQLHEKKNEEVEGEKKKEGILEKLHRSGSGSSSSSSDEEEGEGGEKKKKKKKKEKKESDTSIPVEKCEGESTQPPAEEKKGFLEKIKGKLPGQHKKQEEVPPPAAPAAAESASVAEGEEKGEKKGILEKIKEKLPGYHPKTEEEKEKEKEAH